MADVPIKQYARTPWLWAAQLMFWHGEFLQVHVFPSICLSFMTMSYMHFGLCLCEMMCFTSLSDWLNFLEQTSRDWGRPEREHHWRSAPRRLARSRPAFEQELVQARAAIPHGAGKTPPFFSSASSSMIVTTTSWVHNRERRRHFACHLIIAFDIVAQRRKANGYDHLHSPAAPTVLAVKLPV